MLRLIWEIDGVRSVWSDGRKLCVSNIQGDTSEVDVRTGALMKYVPWRGRGVSENLLVVPFDPPVVGRTDKPHKWKKVLTSRWRDLLFPRKSPTGSVEKKRINKVELYNNTAVVSIEHGYGNERKSLVRMVTKRMVLLLDWSNGKELWNPWLASGSTYRSFGRVIAFGVGEDSDRGALGGYQRIDFFDTVRKKPIKTLDLSPDSWCLFASNANILAIVETPRRANRESSRQDDTLILVDGHKLLFRRSRKQNRRYFVSSQNGSLLVLELGQRESEKRVSCYDSGLKPSWIRKVRLEGMLRPLDLKYYKDVLIIVAESPIKPSRINHYLPRFLYVFGQDGSLLWSSNSIRRKPLPLFTCKKCGNIFSPSTYAHLLVSSNEEAECPSCGTLLEQDATFLREVELERDAQTQDVELDRPEIDDWVLGVVDDCVIVRRGKIDNILAFHDPFGFGMMSTPISILDVYTGRTIREIHDCVQPTVINSKIAYLRVTDHHKTMPYSRRTAGPPTEVIIDDVTRGEILNVKGRACYGVGDCFIINEADKISAYS